MSVERATTLEEDIERLLACPRCHGRLTVEIARITCSSKGCPFEGAVKDDVVLTETVSEQSFFDDKHQVMQRGNEGEGVRCLCYEHQEQFLKAQLGPGSVVLDVGCGPALPYERGSDYFLIGLDPSYESIRANRQVDLRIFGSATSLPLPKQSVDAIFCFYSIHHMVGQTMSANRGIVARAFREFGRVLKSGGELLVFEVNPWPPFGLAETLVWNGARKAIGNKLDMYFWTGSSLADLGRKTFGNAQFRRVSFQAPMLSTFPPVFSMPWLRWPRLLYPFDANLFHWRI